MPLHMSQGLAEKREMTSWSRLVPEPEPPIWVTCPTCGHRRNELRDWLCPRCRCTCFSEPGDDMTCVVHGGGGRSRRRTRSVGNCASRHTMMLGVPITEADRDRISKDGP